MNNMFYSYLGCLGTRHCVLWPGEGEAVIHSRLASSSYGAIVLYSYMNHGRRSLAHHRGRLATVACSRRVLRRQRDRA
jgi:hypothetical protein